MNYIITCKKCSFQVLSYNPNRIRFCASCGTFLNHNVNTDVEQPFHLPEDKINNDIKNNELPDGIIDNLMECTKMLREISAQYLQLDDKLNGKVRDNSIDQRLKGDPKRLESLGGDFSGILPKDESILRVDIKELDDPRWFQKLKKLKF